MTSPPRRPSPAVYRRRRLAVVLAVLLVLGVAVAIVLWQPWNATDAGAQPRPAGTASGVATSPAPAPSATVDVTPTETSAVTPEPTETPAAEDEIAQCSTGSLEVSAVTDKQSYGAGEQPQLSIALTNRSTQPCLIDVGTATQAFTITSGSDVWWRSTDCQSESSSQIVQLAAGQTVSSAAPLSWDRTRSSVDSCDGNRAAARPGYYNLTVEIGGVESRPGQFRLR
ncbi:hypothetical protein N3K63_02685 [Microbacterium sp. W1N]|uniref:hypothetical protein n=1 Tax=Microbacterium festucae TaxID=2977531 RepID=UPI0021C18741|nr:hypothetical protein [Microbacterium festucae]MCT9819188.1 hypothetical protein [Microbacterium festucae]